MTLTARIGVRVLLVVADPALAFAPGVWANEWARQRARRGRGAPGRAMVAFGFEFIVTGSSPRVAFSSGPVTVHRIWGRCSCT